VTVAVGALVGTPVLRRGRRRAERRGLVPLSEPSGFSGDVEVGKDRRGPAAGCGSRRRNGGTLYWLSSIHTDVGYTDLQENALEVHRKESRRCARLDLHPSRLSFHGGMRAASVVVRGEPLARRG